MSKIIVALVGGPMDHQMYAIGETEDPRLQLKTHDLDEKTYVMAVYNRGGVGSDGIQEYVYSGDIEVKHGSLSGIGCEDLWLLGQFPEGFQGYAADVGAYDGVSTSNTLLLEREGWTVLCIEPNPWLESALKHRKLAEICACGSVEQESADFHVHCVAPGAFSALNPIKDNPTWHPRTDAAWDVIKVPIRRLETLLRAHQFPRLDVLSVDVEGAEIDVLEGLDLQEWGVQAIVGEDWDDPGTLTPYLAGRGYRLVERREPNNLYLRV